MSRSQRRKARVVWTTSAVADEAPEVGGTFVQEGDTEWTILEVRPVPGYPGQWHLKLERYQAITDRSPHGPLSCCERGTSSQLTRNLRPGDRVKVHSDWGRHPHDYDYWPMVVVGSFLCHMGRLHVVAVKEYAPDDVYCFDHMGQSFEFSGERWWFVEKMRPRVKPTLVVWGK